jgi:alkanesulfonate monooxygenase SsuD/methylene tetrahydromethanopterin reductase-like flavin-dependent oxidoreductase (luciferase family)
MPEVLVAGNGTRALRCAAAYGDGWGTSWQHDYEFAANLQAEL